MNGYSGGAVISINDVAGAVAIAAAPRGLRLAVGAIILTGIAMVTGRANEYGNLPSEASQAAGRIGKRCCDFGCGLTAAIYGGEMGRPCSGFVASKCRRLKSSLDRRFSLAGMPWRIMGRLRGEGGKLGGYG